MELQPDSPTPLYIQIRDYLRMQIQTGVYAVGSRLPSERELADRLNVSRMTARQALQALTQEGLAYSKVGKGTYVSPTKIDQDLQTLVSFSEECRRLNLIPSSRVLKATVQPADRSVAERLQIAPGTEIVLLKRIRLANGKPLALETAHLDHHLCPNILQKHDFNHESLYEVLREEYGWALVWAEQIIEARLPNATERQLLSLNQETPVLSIIRVTFSKQDRPIEFVTSVYRGDQYHLHTVLRYSAK